MIVLPLFCVYALVAVNSSRNPLFYITATNFKEHFFISMLQQVLLTRVQSICGINLLGLLCCDFDETVVQVKTDYLI